MLQNWLKTSSVGVPNARAQPTERATPRTLGRTYDDTLRGYGGPINPAAVVASDEHVAYVRG
jgi:hypothetical protein